MRNNNISPATSRGASQRGTKMEDSFMQRKREKRSKNKNKLLSSYDSDDIDNATKEKKELKELLRLDNYYKINND